MSTPLLLAVDAAALALSVSRRTAYRLIAAGDLPTVRVRGARRIAESDLRKYVERLAARADTPQPAAVQEEGVEGLVSL